jgi:hypothetical protein
MSYLGNNVLGLRGIVGNRTLASMYENSDTISNNYTLTTGSNGISAGPITINAGIAVTIPAGSTWVIA